ncbi:MAG: S1-like domain-containing RNA-binding protein [Bacteroidaceae bacterium]|nr:S1-like domain-containing RNA-binding protein [Bacteroidaceae bacterium]
MEIGHHHSLKIVRFTDHGAILDGGDSEILMPKKYTTEDMRPGDEVNVFVYLDQSDRLVATKEEPLAEVGEFAYLRVAWTNRFGAFMNWGLMKDLFVPFSQQRHHFEQDRSYIVYIYVDDKTGRIVGTSKLDRCFSEEQPDLEEGQEVNVLIWKETDLGYKVIVNNAFEGLIYKNEIFCPIHIGDKMEAVVKTLRPDGKIDIALQSAGRKLVDDVAEKILTALRDADGFLPYGDHSTPEEIAEHFQVSKKAFKRTVGALYRDHVISIEDDGIRLV